MTHSGTTTHPDTTPDWNDLLLDQLEWHWRHHLRPRLDGLTDEEYLWEPVAGCWSVRPRAAAAAPGATGGARPHGDGAAAGVVGNVSGAVGNRDFTIDLAIPEPSPPPVTTIAWRLAHIIVGVLGARTAAHFGGPAAEYATFPYAGTAGEALRQLDEAYAAWADGVRALGAEGLARPCGPAEGPFADYPMAALVLHINREVIHHGAEALLLRDLYRHRDTLGAPAPS
ncbi:DinB family protein [Streptosporangium sp. NPDC004379]|uniref:DinB family protein n=1 Tax=Streptosporangium sp. NPDC004379 TaxID=3366189 RepID=UPI003690BBE6